MLRVIKLRRRERKVSQFTNRAINKKDKDVGRRL